MRSVYIWRFKETGKNCFTGKDKAFEARKLFKLDREDLKPGKVDIVFPSDSVSMSSLFFVTMFEDSIKNLKSRKKFLEKYNFDLSKVELKECRDLLKSDIEEGIEQCLRWNQLIDYSKHFE